MAVRESHSTLSKILSKLSVKGYIACPLPLLKPQILKSFLGNDNAIMYEGFGKKGCFVWGHNAVKQKLETVSYSFADNCVIVVA